MKKRTISLFTKIDKTNLFLRVKILNRTKIVSLGKVFTFVLKNQKIMTEKKISFGKIFWPSLAAIFIVSILGAFIFFIVLGGFISSLQGNRVSEITDNSILHLTLDGVVEETSSSKLDPFSMKIENKVGLNALLYGFERAKIDEKIKGIFIELKNVQCGISVAKEIRDAINDFEKSGKFVVAYNSGEIISQKEYYISSVANEIYGFPSSTMEFVGLGGELSFFKNTLDMLNVEIQIIRGKNNDFKSAVEPFFLTKMSDSSRLQIQRYINNNWEEMLKDISKERNISSIELNKLAENLKIRRVSDAVDYKLIDAKKYRNEVLEILRNKTKQRSIEQLNLTSFEKYAKKKFDNKQKIIISENPNLAVIILEGDISVDGEGISSEKACKYLREVRTDNNIQTVVLRINSPGGSATASDEIWKEVDLLNKKKKVIVSMGDVAASGGYYIASPAHKIFADPTTITGSIGVFGMIPYTGKMFENKLGITFDQISTNKHAVLSLNRKLTEEEILIIQEEVDLVYTEFLERVASGRGMTKEKVDKVARGRVWTGSDALKVGLVDELGGLQDAISYASKKASLKTTKIVYYPKKKDDSFDKLLELLEEEQEESIKQKSSFSNILLKNYQLLLDVESMRGIQMRLPFEFKFD